MGIVTVHQISSFPGRSTDTCKTLKSVAEALEGEDTLAKLFRVVIGEGSGDFFLHNIYDDLDDLSSKMRHFGADAIHRRLEQALEEPEIATYRGPQLWKLVYSGAAGGNRPLVVQKQYDLPLTSIERFIDLSARIEKIVSQFGADIRTSIPIISDDERTLRLVFRYESETHWAMVEDNLAADDRMTKLMAEAGRLGTLRETRMLMAV